MLRNYLILKQLFLNSESLGFGKDIITENYVSIYMIQNTRYLPSEIK